MLSTDEPDETPARTGFQAAYFAGKEALLGLPRWGFCLLISLATVVGVIVEKLAVSQYSLPKSEALPLSFISVILLGLLTRVVIRGLSRRGIH